MVYRKGEMTSEIVECSVCGGKAYYVGDKDNNTIHCWECDNVDTTVTVDFGSSGWRPIKRTD